MKNNKGITLIALVVTIIVLLILAGVSIAMLTGQNGILNNTKTAKISQIEGQVDEEVKLAIQAAKIYAEEQAVKTPTGWLASENASTIATEMAKDLTTTKGYTSVVGSDAQAASGSTAAQPAKVTVTYTTADYKSATNSSSAKITYVIEIDGNNFYFSTSSPEYVPAHTN